MEFTTSRGGDGGKGQKGNGGGKSAAPVDKAGYGPRSEKQDGYVGLCVYIPLSFARVSLSLRVYVYVCVSV